MNDNQGTDQLRLMAHLMRRAGFTANRNELLDYVTQGYNETVEKLLSPQASNHLPDDLIRRYHVGQYELRQLDEAGAYWIYRMITTENPLEEKMALFWHGLFATGYSKLNQARVLLNQVDASKKVQADSVEINTGKYTELVSVEEIKEELGRIQASAARGVKVGLKIFAGHGLNYENVKDIAAIPEIEELNIGHYIVGQSIYIGMENAVKEMIRSIEGARR